MNGQQNIKFSIVTLSNCSSKVSYDPDFTSLWCISVNDILNYLTTFLPPPQNAEHKLEVELKV